jgi:hypothetical protein
LLSLILLLPLPPLSLIPSLALGFFFICTNQSKKQNKNHGNKDLSFLHDHNPGFFFLSLSLDLFHEWDPRDLYTYLSFFPLFIGFDVGLWLYRRKKICRSGDTKMKGKKPDENGGKQPNPHNPYNPHNPQRSSPPRNTRTPADTVDCARVTGWMLQNPQGAGRLQKQPKSAPPRPVPSPNSSSSLLS